MDMARAKATVDILPQEPETLEHMKARFPAALKDRIDVEIVKNHPETAPSKKRKHVFDYADGMRLIASTDICGPEMLVHISISGDERYAKSIHGSHEEFNEDIFLRLAAFLGHQPPTTVQQFYSQSGVLHLFFKPCDFGIRTPGKG